jgi:hypothetical protein
LQIVWQRLVSPDGTCDRCNATHDEIRQAAKLDAVLWIFSRTRDHEIDENPSHQSVWVNRIWLRRMVVVGWDQGSRCCSVCGDAECRTMEVSGATFETIPEVLFLKAALVAAAQVLDVDEVAAGQRR